MSSRAGPLEGRSVPKLAPSECTYAHFRANHLVPNTPCLFPRALVERWPLFSLWLHEDGTLDWLHLVSRYGALDIDAVDLGSPADESSPRSFGDLLALWQRGAGRAKYLKDWHLPLAVWREGEQEGRGKGKERVRDELYDVPGVCLDDWMNEWEGSDAARGDDFRFVVRVRVALSFCGAATG